MKQEAYEKITKQALNISADALDHKQNERNNQMLTPKSFKLTSLHCLSEIVSILLVSLMFWVGVKCHEYPHF